MIAVALFGLFVDEWTQLALTDSSVNWAVDYTLYHDATNRWLLGDGFYLPRQLAGPYPVVHGDVLYPPTILILLVPFAVLPAWLWWGIPNGIVAAVHVWHRPHPAAWAALALGHWYPTKGVRLIHGNPGIWITAGLALGTVFGWPSVRVLFKPTLGSFALVASAARRWWVALGGLIVAATVFLPMWPDYVRVLLHSWGADGVFHALNEVPMTALRFLAWLGGRRPGARTPIRWSGRIGS